MSSLRLHLARNTVITTLSYLLSLAIALFLTPIVLGTLGAGGYGAWLLILQLTGYAGMLDLGLQPAVAKAVAQAQGSGDTARVRRVFGSALAFNVAIALAVLLCFQLLAPILLERFHLLAESIAQGTSALRWAALGLLFTFPAAMFTALLKGTMRFDQVGYTQIVVNVVRAGGTLFAIKQGAGLVGLAQASLAANAVALLMAMAFAWPLQDRLPWRPMSFVPDELKGLLAYGFAALLAQGGWFLAYASDSVVIGIMLTPADIAYFGLPISIYAVVSGVAGNLAANFLPLASRLQAAGENAALQRSYLLAVRYTAMLTLPMMLSLVVFGTPLLGGWLGFEFASHAAPVLQILAFSYLCSICAGPAVQSALGLGMQSIVARMFITEGVINVGLSIVLARPLGVTGVALGTLIPALVFQGVLWPYFVCAKTELSFIHYLRQSIAPPVLALLAPLPLVIAYRLLLDPQSLAVALFGSILLPLLYWTAAWFTCFDASTRTELRSRALGVFQRSPETQS